MKKRQTGIEWNNSRIFDFAIELLILVVVFIMPTVFDRRLGIVFSGTKTTWMRVLGLLILSVWAIKLIVTRQHRFFRTALDWPVLSFLLCTTIATLSSVHVYTSLVGFYGRYEGLTSWYLFGLFFFVTTNFIRSPAQLKRIIVVVMSAATLMSVYSLIQRFGIDPYMWGGVVTWQRVIGTIGQPNFLAAYMLEAFFMLLVLFLIETREERAQPPSPADLLPLGYFLFTQIVFLAMIYNLEAYNWVFWYLGYVVITASAVLFAFTYNKLSPWIFKIVLGASLLLVYIAILFTQSRGGYMGLSTGLVLFALLAGRHVLLPNWKKLLGLGFFIVLVSGITMSQPGFSPFARFSEEIKMEKVKTEGKIESKLEFKAAAGSRGETWKSAFKIIADHPVFGIGPEVLKMIFPRYETELFRFKEAFHVKQDRCHNETFDVSVTKGLTTFFIYLWLLGVLFYAGWKKARTAGRADKLMLAGLLSASLAFLIQNQFSFGVVAITSLFWMIWAMVMAVGVEERQADGIRFSWPEAPWFMIAGVALVALVLIYVSFFSFRGDVWFKSGKTKMQLRRFSEAVADFERSLKVFPFEGGTVSHKGISQLNLSNVNPAERLNQLNQAIETFNYGTRIDPYNADNFYLLAKIYLMVNDLKQAAANADKALKIDPYYAEVYHLRGLIYERLGKNKEAARHYEKAFMINPNLSQPMQSLEQLNRRLGRQAETLKVFERALKRYSANLLIMERVAGHYLQRGLAGQALAIAEKMVKLNPQLAPGYLLRAAAYSRLNKLEAAYSDLQQVIIKDPKNVIAHLELGRLYLMKGDRARAGEEFAQVLRLDPANNQAKKMISRLK